MGRRSHVIGSMSDAARAQITRLDADPRTVCLKVPVHQLRSEDLAWRPDVLSRLRTALAKGKHAAITIDGPTAPETSAYVDAIADIAASLLPEIGALMLSGGETAWAILSRCGIGALEVVDEFEPGSTLTVSHDARRLPVVLKPGAFGDPETLVRCAQAVSGQNWAQGQHHAEVRS